MAIKPPGDILMEVAKAADPAKLQAAREKLQAQSSQRTARSSQASASALSFAADFRAKSMTAKPDTSTDKVATRPPEHFVKFEAMVLQNFLKTMMPEDTQSVYGEGLAGEMWQGLLAQQVAESIATRGGIGIAERVLSAHYMDGEKKVAIAGISGKPDEARLQEDLSEALVEEIERQAAKALDMDMAATAKSAKP